MKQEEKDLLIKDLCARLPYGVKANNEIQGDFVIDGVYENYIFVRSTSRHGWINCNNFHIEKVKPYLFPLSSMTEEQKKEYKQFLVDIDGYAYSIDCVPQIDWLNKNHFDYRGLIPMGLAIDATGLNVY